MSSASWISGGTSLSIERQPETWKPPIITGSPAARNSRARSRARSYWLDWTPTRPISALAPRRRRPRTMRAGTMWRLVSSIAVRLIATSGPSTCRSAQSAAMPFRAASELDGIIAAPPGDRIAVVVIMRRLDHDEVELAALPHGGGCIRFSTDATSMPRHSRRKREGTATRSGVVGGGKRDPGDLHQASLDSRFPGQLGEDVKEAKA